MESYLDPLGFSRQTETILRGLGATDLIPECERRNISTQTLHELSEDDFVQLGASPARAVEITAALVASARKDLLQDQKTDALDERISHFGEIIMCANEQMPLMQAHIAYAGLRLAEEQLDDFVEPDIPYTASHALADAAGAGLTELDDIQEEIFELERLLKKSKPEQSYTIPTLVMNGMSLLITFGMIFIGIRHLRK